MTDHFADAGKPMPAALRLAELFELFAIDHEPDGWPGVRQAELNEAAAELRRLHAENKTLKAAQQECGFGAGCCYQAAKAEADEALLRQALNALDPPEHLRFGGTGKLKAAAIAAIKERLK